MSLAQLLAVILAPSLVSAFSFNFQSSVQQCQNLSLSITGSGGQPPYRVLILPFGPSPLTNNVEARSIVDQSFGGSATSVSFQLKYPFDSQFVAVVSRTFSRLTGTPVNASLFRSATAVVLALEGQAQPPQCSIPPTAAVSTQPRTYRRISSSTSTRPTRSCNAQPHASGGILALFRGGYYYATKIQAADAQLFSAPRASSASFRVGSRSRFLSVPSPVKPTRAWGSRGHLPSAQGRR